MKTLLAFAALLLLNSNLAGATPSGHQIHRKYLLCADPVAKGCRYDCGFYVGAVCTPVSNKCSGAQPILSAGMYSSSALGDPGPYLAIFDNYAGMQCFVKFQ